jgi:serine protease Do
MMKRLVPTFGGIVLAVLLVFGPANPAAAAQTATDVQARAALNAMSQAFEAAAAKVSPSVVSIFAEQVVQADNGQGMPDQAFRDFFGDQFFRRFFGEPGQGGGQPHTVRGLGSGVIVSRDGLILTNNHVVDKADRLSVVINDGKKSYPAKVVGTAPQTDVAVIRIDAKDLPVAELGNSDDVKVGEWVLAVGNPFQLMHSVTAGIISAKGRSSVGLADYEDFIQTDASINPGNSGGPLVNLAGEVVGVNTAIIKEAQGIGFAIPVNMVKQVLPQLIKDGRITRAWMGIYLARVDSDMAAKLDLPAPKGALIAEVVEEGPAHEAGLRPGDVIVEFDGKEITEAGKLPWIIATSPIGSPLKVKVIREGKEKEVEVTLLPMPQGS